MRGKQGNQGMILTDDRERAWLRINNWLQPIKEQCTILRLSGLLSSWLPTFSFSSSSSFWHLYKDTCHSTCNNLFSWGEKTVPFSTWILFCLHSDMPKCYGAKIKATQWIVQPEGDNVQSLWARLCPQMHSSHRATCVQLRATTLQHTINTQGLYFI